MFFFEVLSFFVKVFAVAVALVVLQIVILFLIWAVSFSKKLITLAFINKVHHVTFYPSQKKYKRAAVETGYTVRTHSTSTHYRYYDVYCGLYRDVVVAFKGGIKIKMNLREDGILCRRLHRV